MTGKTQYPNLGYVQFAPGAWCVLQRDDETMPFIGAHRTGPTYATKTELLSDICRIAKEWGYDE